MTSDSQLLLASMEDRPTKEGSGAPATGAATAAVVGLGSLSLAAAAMSTKVACTSKARSSSLFLTIFFSTFQSPCTCSTMKASASAGTE